MPLKYLDSRKAIDYPSRIRTLSAQPLHTCTIRCVLYKLIQDTVVWRDAELVCQADEHQEGLQLPGGLGG